jgi:tetratricopeptide (TPR) repeat protein
MKRVHRKQLKEDEFVSTFNKLFNFIKKRKREFMMGGAALCAALLVFIGVQTVRSQSLKRQNVKLSQSFQIREDLNTNPDKIADLEKMAGRGKFARSAYLQLGTYWFEQGDFIKAMDQLDNISDKRKDLLYYQVQNLKAQIHFLQKNYDESIRIYDAIEEEKPKNFSLDSVLFNKARAFEEKGDKEQALLVYKRIQEDYAQTYYAMDAAQKITKLEEKK